MPIGTPFDPTHSTDSFVETSGVVEALQRLDRGLGAREPFMLITGDSGIGKTALVHQAIARWGSRVAAVFLACPALTGNELLEEILLRLGAEPPQSASHSRLVALLERTIGEITSPGQVAIIVVDDAHRLSVETLEEMRMLVNAMQQAHRPIEVMLIGGPTLEARLEEPALTAFRQRVSARVRLAPLTDADTERYVQHRVTAAGGDGPTVFSQETCLEIAAASQGVPRQINTVASEALNLAAESGEAFVTPAHVQTAVSTLWGSAPSTSVKKSAAPRPATVAETPVAPAPPVAERSPVVPTAPPRASVASSAWKEDPDDSPTPIVTSHDPHEWVARFVGDRGPLQIGSRTKEPSTWDLDLLNAGHAAPRKISTPVTPVEQPTPSPAPAATAAPAAAAAPHEPAVPKPPAALVTKTIASDEPTPKAPTREESEPRTRASAPSLPAPPSAKPAVSGRMLSIAGASVAVIVAVALIIRANNQVGDRSQPASNAVVDSSKAPESHSERKAESTESSVPQLTATPPEKVLPEPPAESPAEPASKPDAEPTPPPAKLKPPYSVEVGAFDSEDIAYDQRDRFEALTGIEGWVVEPKKDGPRKYRIVLGIFSSEKRATSAANMLVKSQTLLRAKVVSLPPRHSRN